jgi:hypothetical protein
MRKTKICWRADFGRGHIPEGGRFAAAMLVSPRCWWLL